MTIEYEQLLEDMKNEKTTTVPRKVRGTLTIKAGDDMEFKAYRETGESSQQQVARNGDSKLYRTVGEKKQTMVAHIVVPNDAADPRAEIYEQVEQLTKDLPQGGRAVPKLKGKSLLRDDDTSVVACAKEHKIQVTLSIDVSQYPDYTSRLLTLMQRVNQCFATNQTSLAKLRS